jgi:hypothetical protein
LYKNLKNLKDIFNSISNSRVTIHFFLDEVETMALIPVDVSQCPDFLLCWLNMNYRETTITAEEEEGGREI